MLADDSRDVMIAKEAIIRGKLPLFGPFSSAGPFVFGPLYYWFAVFCYLLFPRSLESLWVMLGILDLVNVGIFYLCGYLLGGKRLGLITAFFAAISPQMVFRSMIFGPHSFISITTSFSILFFILFSKTKKLLFLLLMGIALGAAINTHYQAINLLFFLPAIFFIPAELKKKIKGYFALAMGFLFPSLPLLVWDSQQNFANIRNLADYFLIGQYRIYVPNSWKLFIFKYIPNYWSFVSGGNTYLAFFMIVVIASVFLYLIIKKKIGRPLFILISVFSVMMFLNRFYRGERSEGYLIYFSPFIIIFTSYVINFLLSNTIKRKSIRVWVKLSGIILITILIIGNGIKIASLIIPFDNHLIEIKKTVEILSKNKPKQGYALFDFDWFYGTKSYPLALIMEEKKLLDPQGIPIGVTCNPYPAPIIMKYQDKCKIIDLSGIKGRKDEKRWLPVSQKYLYDDLITRWTNNKLPTNFRFFNKF
ncbi:MAG: Oligosaccharyl transferase STT3 subunit [Candidatus Gottesmanbacteria bacterium GW2011_GWC2_39_8]|uniref:Oligosaccharyl transferase STT3 subunit n=1 Tax=Candidatus Gottesmanbacteria bacterium GW2011_GWC2_39_8 TaxID=1618450 RepID=A0A0G0Q251_9BACT|nr:MAG: Oligosaccharyl transferase STT3 subunit [Candidatus Gottesmanbacteria bacterium GW2011_GWC2_39_8]